jgi:hypothetical protein
LCDFVIIITATASAAAGDTTIIVMNISDQLDAINVYPEKNVLVYKEPNTLMFLVEVASFFLTTLANKQMMSVKVFVIYESSGWLLYVLDEEANTCVYLEVVFASRTYCIYEARRIFKEVWSDFDDTTTWLKINLTFGSVYFEDQILVESVPDNGLIVGLCDGSISKYCEDIFSNWYINLRDDFLRIVARLNVHECAMGMEKDLLMNIVQFMFSEYSVLTVAMFRDIVVQVHGMMSYTASTTWMDRMNERMWGMFLNGSSDGGGSTRSDGDSGSNNNNNNNNIGSIEGLSLSPASSHDDDPFIDISATEQVSSLSSSLIACPSIDNNDNVSGIEGHGSLGVDYIRLVPIYGTFIS